MTPAPSDRAAFMRLIALGAAIVCSDVSDTGCVQNLGRQRLYRTDDPGRMSCARSNQHRRARFIHPCLMVDCRCCCWASLFSAHIGTSAVDRYLSVRLGRSGASGRHQSLSLRAGGTRAGLPAGCGHLPPYQPLGLCGYDLPAGRADVLFRRDPSRRERHNDEAGLPRLRGRHGRHDLDAVAADGSPGHADGCLSLASIANVGNCQQWAHRRAHGCVDDDGAMACDLPQDFARGRCDFAGRSSQAVCDSCASGLLASLGLARASACRRNRSGLLRPLFVSRNARLWISGGLPAGRRYSRRWRQLVRERVASGVRCPSSGLHRLSCPGWTDIGRFSRCAQRSSQHGRSIRFLPIRPGSC